MTSLEYGIKVAMVNWAGLMRIGRTGQLIWAGWWLVGRPWTIRNSLSLLS